MTYNLEITTYHRQTVLTTYGAVAWTYTPALIP